MVPDTKNGYHSEAFMMSQGPHLKDGAIMKELKHTRNAALVVGSTNLMNAL